MQQKEGGYMDSMMKQLVELILDNPGIPSQELRERLQANKSQVDYRIKKLNDYLVEKKAPLIEKKNHRYYLNLDEHQLQQFLDYASLIHLQGPERQSYVVLLIILYPNMTLGTLADRLGVSRNTILSDIKAINQLLRARQLGVRSTRAKGYFLTGKEIDIRKLWFFLIKGEIEKDFSLSFLKRIVGIDLALLSDIEQRIGRMEDELQLHFSEVKVAYLTLIIYLSVVRYLDHERIQPKEIERYADLLNQEIYQVVALIFAPLFQQSQRAEGIQQDDTQELRFIIMHVLSINIVKRTSFRQSAELVQAINQSIDHFEKASITFFEKKQELCDVLYQHIIPASYRIRFGVPDEESLAPAIRQEYWELYAIVKKAIQPIEQNLEIEFVEEELSYLLIIFLGFLKADRFPEEKGKTAVVVCMHGVSVSRLLLENLKELLPTIHFKRYLSLREFYDLNPEVDIIFSTVAIDTEIPTYFIKHFLTETEKRSLKTKVERDIFGFHALNSELGDLDLDELMLLIEKHADIRSKKRLRQELEHYLSQPQLQLETEAPHPVFAQAHALLRLLPRQNIQIYEKDLTFAEAIRLSAKPLLKNGSIGPAYVEQILETYNPDYPYFVIAPEVAIPHAGPEAGVNRLGMSLLRVNQPIPFSKDLEVRLIVMIAPKDKKSHLSAVSTLYNLVNDASFRQQILNARYEQDIYDLLLGELTGKMA